MPVISFSAMLIVALVAVAVPAQTGLTLEPEPP
jgi:hypothetical protein